MPSDTPDRRTFVLQLYDNVQVNVFGLDLAFATGIPDRFEEEAVRLDTLAQRIDFVISVGIRASRTESCTSIRHDNDGFHCFVGTGSHDMVLIVMPRTDNALDWSPPRISRWVRRVANKWLEASGYAPIDGNNPPLRPMETTGHVADSKVATGAEDG